MKLWRKSIAILFLKQMTKCRLVSGLWSLLNVQFVMVAHRKHSLCSTVVFLFFLYFLHEPGHRLQLLRNSRIDGTSATSYIVTHYKFLHFKQRHLVLLFWTFRGSKSLLSCHGSGKFPNEIGNATAMVRTSHKITLLLIEKVKKFRSQMRETKFAFRMQTRCDIQLDSSPKNGE